MCEPHEKRHRRGKVADQVLRPQPLELNFHRSGRPMASGFKSSDMMEEGSMSTISGGGDG